MFYTTFVLAKKGPLARIWLAAHWDKKLTKAHVFETNIESSVEGILQPKVKMALRTSGHLLLGIVRIYSRKAKYLLADCNEAFIKIKIAFRPGVVDLPEGSRQAPASQITLPEVFHDFDAALPDISIDMDAQVSLNQSRAEDITLKEDYGTLNLMNDDGFDDMGFDEAEAARDVASFEDGLDSATLLLGGVDSPAPQPVELGNVTPRARPTLDAPIRDDGFGGTVGEGLLDGETGALFEPAGLFDDAPLGVELEQAPEPSISEGAAIVAPVDDKAPEPLQNEEDSDDDMYDMAPGSMGAPSPPSSPETPPPQSEPIPEPASVPDVAQRLPEFDQPPPGVPEMPPPPPPPSADHTVLMHNDMESFALAPLDTMIAHGADHRIMKTRRKRKLVIDEIKSISGEEMKSQLNDTRDIVGSLDLAPPTRRLTHWKETGGVEKLFSLPAHPILSKTLSKIYLRHLTTRSVETDDPFADGDAVDLEPEIEKARDEESTLRESKRLRLMDSDLPHDLSQVDPLQLDSSRSFLPYMEDLPHMHSVDAGPSLHHMPPTMHHESPFDTHLLHTPNMSQQMSSFQPAMSEATLDYMPPLMEASRGPPEDETTQIFPQEQFEPKDDQPKQTVNHMDHQTAAPPNDHNATADANLIFDTLINDLPPDFPGGNFVADLPPENAVEDQEKMQATNNNLSSETVQSDDDDDFGAPASVGPILPEEQMADETYEQFEERVLTKRTTHLLHVVHDTLSDGGRASFAHLTRNSRRKQVAQKFYTFLVLKKQQAVELDQEDSTGDMIITRGPKFDAVYNAN